MSQHGRVPGVGAWGCARRSLAASLLVVALGGCGGGGHSGDAAEVRAILVRNMTTCRALERWHWEQVAVPLLSGPDETLESAYGAFAVPLVPGAAAIILVPMRIDDPDARQVQRLRFRAAGNAYSAGCTAYAHGDWKSAGALDITDDDLWACLACP